MKKLHIHGAGYIDEIVNPFARGKRIALYNTKKSGLPFSYKYAICCHFHSSLVGTSDLEAARFIMKNIHHFCGGCRKILGDKI